MRQWIIPLCLIVLPFVWGYEKRPLERKRKDAISVNGPRGGQSDTPSLMFWEEQDSFPNNGYQKNLARLLYKSKKTKKSKKSSKSNDDLSHMLEAVKENDMSMSMDYGEAGDCISLPQNQAVFNLLSESSKEATLTNSSTSQGKAYRWMTTFKRTLDPCRAPSQTLQLYALSVLYFATNGSNWTKREGWMKNENYCTWYGITCDFDDNVFELILGKSSESEKLIVLGEKECSNSIDFVQTKTILRERYQRK